MAKVLEGVASGGWGDLDEVLHRYRDLAVAEDLHAHAQVHVEGCQRGAAGLAGAVHGDLGNVRLCDAAVEAAVEVAGVDGGAVPGPGLGQSSRAAWVAGKARREGAVRPRSLSMGVCPRPGSTSTP